MEHQRHAGGVDLHGRAWGEHGLEDILGKDHESQVALAVISAAISAALIGAAPIALAIFRKSWSDVGEDRSRNTVIGVLVATQLVLTAAAGQIVVMAVVLTNADVIDDALTIGLASAAGVALFVYAVQTVPLTLADGLVKPPTASSEVEALDKVAAAIVDLRRPPGEPLIFNAESADDKVFAWASSVLAAGDTEAPDPEAQCRDLPHPPFSIGSTRERRRAC